MTVNVPAFSFIISPSYFGALNKLVLRVETLSFYSNVFNSEGTKGM